MKSISRGVTEARGHGKLLIIGGHEDKVGETQILKEFAKHARNRKVCIVTVATKEGDAVWATYKRLFSKLGLKRFSRIDSPERDQVSRTKAAKALAGARAVFITGGDQLRITSGLGGTVACADIQKIYEKGGIVAGTSAGASVMSETMLMSGAGDASSRLGDIRMAPGLAFTRGLIVDQHFAERGRLGRLIGAVGLNPKFLGVGIDEDTAILFETPTVIRVLGKGAVYILDGITATQSNVSEARRDAVLSMTGLTLHVIADGDRFDLSSREKVMKDGPLASPQNQNLKAMERTSGSVVQKKRRSKSARK